MTAPELRTRLAGLTGEFDMATQAWIWLTAAIPQIAGAVAVLVIGVILARLLSKGADRALTRSGRIEPTVAKFLGNVIKYALWVVVGVTVLTQFGVQTTSIIAALGGLALAVGLALQGTLSNVAAGVMILIQRPFRVGEAINAGPVTGTIQSIGLFTTEMLQYDGLYVMVPNSELWNKPIINFSRMPTRRFELLVGIGYGDNIAQARKELLDLADAEQRVLAEPEPTVFVSALADSAVTVGMRVWTKTEDYLGVSWALTEAAKIRFDEVGISIPFPQREVHHITAQPKESKPPAAPASDPEPRAGASAR